MDTRQQHNANVSPDEWYTPRWIIDTLGPFDFFGSCLVAWGDKCDRRLRESKIEGKYVVLNE